MNLAIFLPPFGDLMFEELNNFLPCKEYIKKSLEMLET